MKRQPNMALISSGNQSTNNKCLARRHHIRAERKISMKPIIINGNHTEKLEAALNEVQARCKARTLTVSDVERILEVATAKMPISKTAMKGTRFTYTGAEKFPAAYKYRPESTHVVAEHNGRFWVIMAIFRSTCHNRNDNASLTLSDSAREAVLASFESFEL